MAGGWRGAWFVVGQDASAGSGRKGAAIARERRAAGLPHLSSGSGVEGSVKWFAGARAVRGALRREQPYLPVLEASPRSIEILRSHSNVQRSNHARHDGDAVE